VSEPEAVQDARVRIELDLRRGVWNVFAVLLTVTGVPFSIAAIALLVVSLLDRHGGDLVGGLIFLLLGAVATPAGVAAWHLGRAYPALVVDDYGLTLDHPGVLKRPLRLDRSEVHSVYVRSFPGHERSPTFDGTGWERFRQRVRWVDSRGGPQCLLPVGAMDAPDLSVLDVFEDRNLLIVLATSSPMKSLARRGLGSLALAVARGPGYSGPTRATVARGLFGVVGDEHAARVAFASWPSADTPAADVWDWLYGEKKRGGFEMRRSAPPAA
jgi:hypothetical protein